MTRPTRLVPALLLAATMLLPLPEALAQTPVAESDPALEARLTEISDEVAALRGLPPLPTRTDRFITREALRADLPRQITEENPPEEIAAITRSYVALGLLPPGSDPLAEILALLGDQIAGYYDTTTREMFVIADEAGLSPEAEFTYAHETVHALQDAHLALQDDVGEGNDDASLAYSALVEGDASSLTVDYAGANPDLVAGLLRAAPVDTGVVDAAPPALTVPLFFPYLQGQAFVGALRDAGGWARVDAAYADPPTSSEQILHPEKFLAGEAPVAVALPDGSALGAGWQTVDENTLGELMTAVLLADLQPGEVNADRDDLGLPVPARNAADGWGGDRYALWSDGTGDVLVWRSVWDTERDAIAFSRALAAREGARWGAAFAPETPADLRLETPEIAARITVAGREVRYVQAPDPALADRALTALQDIPAATPAP